MEGKKNLCAMISTDLHAKIMAEKEQLELNTLAEYVERIFTEHFEGGQISMKAERTLAVQIPAELFERLKEYLAARNLKQKQFLIQLIENALDDTEAESFLHRIRSEYLARVRAAKKALKEVRG